MSRPLRIGPARKTLRYTDFLPTTLLLLRHGMTDLVGHTLAGRASDIHLNEMGRRQADALAQRLVNWPVAALYSSPLERTQETAQPISRLLQLPIHTVPALQEIDFGDWTGRRVKDLEGDEGWRSFNQFRAAVACPGGERMIDVLQRAVSSLEEIRQRHPEQTVAVVSHADVIRAVLAHFLGMNLDHMLRLEIAPCSVSVVDVASWGPRVIMVNSQ